MLLACVHSADLHDGGGARRLVNTQAHDELPRVELVWADQGYTGAFAQWLWAECGWRLEIVHRPERQLWRYGLEEKPKHTAPFTAEVSSTTAGSPPAWRRFQETVS